MNNNLVKIKALLKPEREKLINHPIYELITEPTHVRTFMQQHVFAVWDFMSLLKFLQSTFCGCEIPWRPGKNHPLAARLINEIVLAEESDLGPEGQFLSHFEMYRMAMLQAGAPTTDIDLLLAGIESGKALDDILGPQHFPAHVCDFVRNTFESIEKMSIEELAAIFLFGREDLIPDLFRGLVNQLNRNHASGFTVFEYYLDRHIEIDGDQHGPMGEELLSLLCGTDQCKWEAAGHAAKATLQSRLAFWDGIMDSVIAL